MPNTNPIFNGNLSFREARSCLTAGARGGPWADVEARIRAASGTEADHVHRVKELHLEQKDVARRQEDLQVTRAVRIEERGQVEHKLEETIEGRPSLLLALAWALFAAVLLLGDAAFLAQTFADALGVSAYGYVAPFVALIVLGVTVLTLAVTAYAGILAAGDTYSPAKRMLGWALLGGVSLLVAVLRAASAPDAPVVLAILGFALGVVAGLACGEAKERVAEFLVQWGRYRQEVRHLRKRLRVLDQDIRRIDRDIELAAARRRGIAEELDDLGREPERIQWHTELRLARARSWYDAGAWLTRKGSKTPKPTQGEPDA